MQFSAYKTSFSLPTNQVLHPLTNIIKKIVFFTRNIFVAASSMPFNLIAITL